MIDGDKALEAVAHLKRFAGQCGAQEDIEAATTVGEYIAQQNGILLTLSTDLEVAKEELEEMKK